MYATCARPGQEASKAAASRGQLRGGPDATRRAMLLDDKGRAHEYAHCIPGRQTAKRVSDTTRQEEGGMHTNAQGKRHRWVACGTAPSTLALLQLPLRPSTYCHCHGASSEVAMLVKLDVRAC
jgi:hypothetical protein